MKIHLREVALLSVGIVSLGAAEKITTVDRLQDSATVLQEIMAADDKKIPDHLLADAHCVVVIPGAKKGAFIVGATYGKGFMTCRSGSRRGWSAPGAVRMEGGSFGFQIGGSETDVVLLVMNDQGEKSLLSSKFTLGAEGEVAAGPVGRETTAQTDAKLTAEILSWSRTHGVFAGIALKGATLRQDIDDNAELYGRRLENREIITDAVKAPPAARPLLDLLSRYSPTVK
jgi:lipid-binding SYLF domain-containing protein